MRIAFCDDDFQELERISKIMESYAFSREAGVSYRLFSDAEDMIRAARTEGFTHYFLDILMPGMDGIEAAREIRIFDGEAKLIFLTSSNEFACQSYRVKAHDYLLKPVDESAMFAILDALQEREESIQESICVESGRSVLRISCARLSHLEVSQKKLYFYLTDGRVHKTSGTMAEFERELLARPEFIKIHRSYIVNIRQISELSPEGCIMFSGKNLPVSRLLYNQVRREYMAQLFGNAGV